MQRPDDQDMDEESPSGESSSVGETLRKAREALDLQIEQVAGDLRVEVSYLVALEADEFGEFSAPVFAKGYLKQYSQRLGLDDKALLTLYYRQVGAQQVPKLRIQTLELGEDQRQARWLIAGSALAFVVAAISIWQFSTPEPEAVIVSQPVVDNLENEAVELTPAAPPQEATVTAPLAASVADPVDDAAEIAVPELQVEIVFHEDCWTEVIDVHGERLFYGLGSAGARSRFSATPPLSFFLGNASGVDLSVDEMPYEIPSDNREGNLARFVILESGD